MIRAYRNETAGLVELARGAPVGEALWIDLVDPSPEDIATAADALGARVPEREDMLEIEVSSRLFHEGDVSYITVLVPENATGRSGRVAPVTFVLAPGKLVTVRYVTPQPFETYPEHARAVLAGCDTPRAVLLGLFEECIDRTADILEWLGDQLEERSQVLFRPDRAATDAGGDLQHLLREIGRMGDLVGDIRAGLLTFERALGFIAPAAGADGSDTRLVQAHEVIARDVRSLSEHTGFVSGKISLMLDGTMGMINIQQNNIIKLFSVVAVALMPPTLIASIYGMNFRHMPELSHPAAYPLALVAMLLSAIVPFVYFKRRGWL